MDDAVACSIILVTIPMYTLALIRRRKVNWLHNSSNLFIGTYGGSLAIIIKSQEAVEKLIIMKQNNRDSDSDKGTSTHIVHCCR